MSLGGGGAESRLCGQGHHKGPHDVYFAVPQWVY